MKIGVLQLNSGSDPSANLPQITDLYKEAVQQGAEFIFTPEVTNCVSLDRMWQQNVLCTQEDDETLTHIHALALETNTWVSIGSLGLKGGSQGRFVNRSFVISPGGKIAATYDKIHMFDVDISDTESYRESAGYAPGERAVLCNTPFGKIGLSICYDLRFPNLYRMLAQAGAHILTIPAAFSTVTGVAHWEPLLRARAIETGCFVIAAAQTGTHHTDGSKDRHTYGHSMVVDPWGRVLLDAGSDVGAYVVNLDLNLVGASRKRVPSLLHDRDYYLSDE